MNLRSMVFAVSALFSVIPAQGISISGIVTDSASGSPVNLATVTLLGSGTTDTTGADGVFSIDIDDMAIINGHPPAGSSVPFLDLGGLLTVNLNQQRDVVVHGYTLQGQLSYSLRETWAEGLRQIKVPATASGIMIYTVTIGEDSYAMRRSTLGSRWTAAACGVPAKQPGKTAVAQSGAFGDTLLIAKNGYETVRIAVTDPVTANLSIKLKATATVAVTNGLILFTATKPRAGVQSNDYYEIYTMKSDRSEITQLTSNEFKDCRGRWSPDGKKIAFVRITGSTTTVSEIWMMNADGSNQERIAYGDYVCFSPDGSKLAITKNELFIYDVQTKESTSIVGSTIYTGTCMLPDWAPDGKTIAYVNHFVYTDANYYNIYIVNADGANNRQLTKINEFSSQAKATEPRWSPGGSFIVFDIDNTLYLMKADGTQQTPLGISPVYYPLFSPDESSVIVSLNDKIVQVKMDASFSKTTLTTDADGVCYPMDWKTP